MFVNVFTNSFVNAFSWSSFARVCYPVYENIHEQMSVQSQESAGMWKWTGSGQNRKHSAVDNCKHDEARPRANPCYDAHERIVVRFCDCLAFLLIHLFTECSQSVHEVVTKLSSSFEGSVHDGFHDSFYRCSHGGSLTGGWAEGLEIIEERSESLSGKGRSTVSWTISEKETQTDNV